MLVMTMFAPAAFAATDEPTQEPTETTQPTDEPTQEPTQTPTPTQKPTATPTPTQKPTQTPTQEPTQEPTQTPTQAPSEDSGNETVNVTLYVYSGGAAASGYTVKLDTVSQKTNKEGMVSYPDVTVEDLSLIHILIVEDIIDSGVTLSNLKEMLKGRTPESIEMCCLLNKPDRRKVEVPVKYIGFDLSLIHI